MDLRRKLAILADAAKYDASCASSGSKGRRGAIGSTDPSGICHSYTPDGRCVSLLKILLTNHCVFDCRYCVNRASSDVERARFTPREVVDLTLALYRRNAIEGLFLSSGVIKSADHTMGELIEVARALREDHGFGGYIHLKTVAGASPELVEQAGVHADRVSCNIELPTAIDLAKLAPEKRADEIDGAMATMATKIEAAREEPRAPKWAPAGQSTQMIVGATPTHDGAVLRTADRLYQTHKLRRIYYCAYSPTLHADGGLPASAPPQVREHRLYQADWLLRNYGFSVDEVVASEHEDLDPEIDPKLAWALRNRDLFPLDVNRAPRELLLRVPGFGTRAVRAILDARRHRRLGLEELARLRVPLRKAKPFLAIDRLMGSPPARVLDRLDLEARLRKPAQLELFSAASSARSGEV